MKDFAAVLVEQCAPTLARVKPANLFSYRPQAGEDIPAAVSYWNKLLRTRGIQIFLIKYCRKKHLFLVYVYRNRQLTQILHNQDVQAFLQEVGYAPAADAAGYLRQMQKRVCLQEEFPHEIGIFLGYPLCDVLGFMKHQGKNFTCSGLWKAYGDAEAAQKQFEHYKKCAAVYKRLYEEGRSILQLTVAA